MALIKFNLLDFFQLPLEWAGGVNRATLEEREKELAEEKFPLEIVQTSVHWSTSKRGKRKLSRGERRGVAKYLRNIVCNIFYSAPIFAFNCRRNIYLWIAWLGFCVQDKVLCFCLPVSPASWSTWGSEKRRNSGKMHFSQKLNSLIIKVESSHCHQYLERIQRNYEFLMTWVLLHFELMTVHFTEGKHITLPIQPEGERERERGFNGDTKEGFQSRGQRVHNGHQMLFVWKQPKLWPECPDYQRGPQSPTEGHRGLLSATGGSGEPSQNRCETKSTGRGEENYSPGGRKCSSIQFMFMACWHSPVMSLWKTFF